MKTEKGYFSFLKSPIAITLYGLFFGFFFLLLNFNSIQNYFFAPTPEEVQGIDSLVVKARDLSRVDPDESLRITLDVLARSQKLNYQKGLADSYRLLSLAASQARSFVLTKEYIEKSKSLYEELDDAYGLADIENSYGGLMIYMGDTAGAIPHYRKALDRYAALNLPDRQRIAAFNLAFSYSAIPNFDSAKYFLQISENLKQGKDEVPGFAVTQGLKGKIKYFEGDYTEAEKYFKESLDYYNNNPQQSFVAFFESTLFLSRIYHQNGKIDEALSVLNNGLKSEALFLSETLARQVFITLVTLYEELGDYKNSDKVFWEKERFEAELDRRKTEQARNFSAELSLFRGFQLENQELSSRLSTITMLSLVGGSFTFIFLLLFLRVIFLNRRNRELKTLVDKSYQLAQIGTFEVELGPEGKVDLNDVSEIIYSILAVKPNGNVIPAISLNRLLDEPQQEKLRSIIEGYSGTNDFFKEEFDIKNLNGERKIVRVIAKVIPISKGGILLKGLLLDITNEHQFLEQTLENLEKEKNLKELREQLMHMTSHEFRTPLSNISSSVELISLLYTRINQEDLQQRFKTIVENAKGNIKRLVGMLDELLLYERVQTNEFELRIESFDLGVFLESLINEVKEAKNSDANVLLMLPNKGIQIQSDKDLIHHIFTNLLGNSIKYLDKKLPIEFEVATTKESIMIRIKDYGIGIPEKDMERLFTPFKRASNVAGRPGTGLGLSIVKRMVTKLGGDIKVTSKEGEFSEFKVILPKTKEIVLGQSA